MGTERDGSQDEDVPFHLPQRRSSTIESGFTRAAITRDASDKADDVRLSPKDRKDVPHVPLAERGRRGA
jgi:hypothetical protein